MKSGMPKALVYGVENFVAQRLVEELIKKDILVVGLGEELPTELTNKGGFEYKLEVEEIEREEVDYWFDFVGSEKIWEMAAGGGKLTVVTVNRQEVAEIIKKRINQKQSINWRLVELVGVYGKGMGEDGFLAEAFRQAASNHNLILPTVGVKFRTLGVDDGVEAVLRASFLSGTEGENFLVAGKETDSEEVARVLVDEAKMTRFKVMQKEMAVEKWREEEVRGNWDKLRWEPRVDFKEGAVETLRYFLTKIDEENRRGRSGERIRQRSPELVVAKNDEPEETRKLFDVVVEGRVEQEGDKREENTLLNSSTKKKKKIKKRRGVGKKRIEGESIGEEVVGKPLTKEVVPTEIKNSNSRPVAEKGEITEDREEKRVTVEGVESKPVIVVKRQSQWRWWYLVAVFGVGLGIILMVPMGWLRAGWVGYKNVNRAVELAEARKYSEAEKVTVEALEKIRKASEMIGSWGANRWVWGRRWQGVLRVEEEAAILARKGIKLARLMEEIDGVMFKEKEVDLTAKLKETEDSLREVERQMNILQARMNGDWSWLPARFKPAWQKAGRQLEEYEGMVRLARGGVEILPEILGADGKRREYLVLLQNEMELRPGGGFIGSYGILSFENGQLLNFEVRDVYEADGQLKGHVEPPVEIKTYLGEAGWFMRDANWEANFVRASKDIVWFLEKSTGRKVDGVVGINLAVARKILEATGEVFVPDFREKINKDNLFEQAEFYAETKFFPGSNQKASFLGGLGKQLFEEIKELDSKGKMKLYLGLVSLLESNDIQISVNAKTAALKLAEMGWDGSIYQGKCGMERCMADYLYIVEANLGVNKANYFLYRNVEQLVEISQNAVTRVLKINYENRAKSTNWPGGDYKNYLRLYLPADINLAEVSITDAADKTKKETITGEKLMMKEVEGKRELGMLVLVPVATKRTVEVRYSTGIDLTGKDKFSYLHYIQRQSGFGDTGMVTLVTYPKGWSPVQVEPAASMVGEKLLFNMKLEKDIRMGVELGK